MNEFIEKNRRLLHFYCIAARIMGSVLLIAGLAWGCTKAVALVSRINDWEAFKTFVLADWPSGIFKFILLGLVALGIAQFIRYLFDREYKAGWILHNGDKILYVCAVLLIGNHVWIYINDSSFNLSSLYLRLLLGLLMLLYTAAKVLILIGLAQTLRRIMPVIEESKTLV